MENLNENSGPSMEFNNMTSTKNLVPTLFHKIFPSLFAYLSTNDILALRAADTRSKKSIDEFLESDEPWKKRDSNGLQKIKLNLFQHPTLRRQERYAKVMSEMSLYPNAKIVGGSVYIHNTFDENWNLMEFYPFFWQFGRKFLHLAIRVKLPYGVNPIHAWKIVINLLVHTPNVKSLSVTVIVFVEEDEYHAIAEKLDRFFQKKKFPLLENLISLRLIQHGREIWTILETDRPPCQAFVRAYGSKLQHLCLGYTPGPIPFPEKLKRLVDLEYIIRNSDDFAAMKKLSAPLEKLEFLIYHSRPLLNPVQHLEFLENFSSTLKYLKVSSWPGGFNLVEDVLLIPSNKLCLPHLQELTLWEYTLTKFPSLDFLLNFPKLRCFHFSWEYTKLWGTYQKTGSLYHIQEYLQPNMYINKEEFYKCPIWNLLHYLETVELEVRVSHQKFKSCCFRTEYNRVDL